LVAGFVSGISVLKSIGVGVGSLFLTKPKSSKIPLMSIDAPRPA
jgi:hypothetical protein